MGNSDKRNVFMEISERFWDRFQCNVVANIERSGVLFIGRRIRLKGSEEGTKNEKSKFSNFLVGHNKSSPTQRQ